MSHVNSALSMWQLAILVVVPLALLMGWLAAIFIAAREPRRPEVSAAVPAALVVVAVVADREMAGPTTAGARQPEPGAEQPVAA